MHPGILQQRKNYLKEKKYTDALNYLKKVIIIQPENEKIRGLIRICSNQIEPGMDSSIIKNYSTNQVGAKINVTRFDLPQWSYPGVNKNEFSINSSELNFTNTISEKFIIYDADLNDLSIAVHFEVENSNSNFGLILGYNSPSEYYIFKYNSDDSYILQKINGDEVEKLLVINSHNSNDNTQKLIKIQYSDNTITVYNETGLLNTYRSYMKILGKAGLYVNTNTSVRFKSVSLIGETIKK